MQKATKKSYLFNQQDCNESARQASAAATRESDRQESVRVTLKSPPMQLFMAPADCHINDYLETCFRPPTSPTAA
jgi:hypothetical protein